MNKITTTLSLKNLESKIKNLGNKNHELKVGFLTPEMAKIAMQNEYGGIYPVSSEYRERAAKAGVILGETIKIIPRPFMATTIKNNQKTWKSILNDLLGQNKDSTNSLDILGEKIKSDLQNTIVNNDFKRNPLHIAKIKGRDKPLIDTGTMFNSIEHEVK